MEAQVLCPVRTTTNKTTVTDLHWKIPKIFSVDDAPEVSRMIALRMRIAVS